MRNLRSAGSGRPRVLPGRVRGVSAVVALALVLVVGGELSSQVGAAPGARAEREIRPVLVVASQTAGAAALELHLRRVNVPDRIASFQGELRYDAARLTLRGASMPRGITGAWHETVPGTIRFAGVSMDGIEAGAVLTLSFASRGAIEGERFALTVEELVASGSFRDLRPSVLLRDGRPEILLTRP